MAVTRAIGSSITPTCVAQQQLRSIGQPVAGSGYVTRSIKPPASSNRPVSKLAAMAKRKVLPRLTGTVTTSASTPPQGNIDHADGKGFDPDWVILEPLEDSTVPHLRFLKKSELQTNLAGAVSDLRVISRSLLQRVLMDAVKANRITKEKACEIYDIAVLCTGRVDTDHVKTPLRWHPARPRTSDRHVTCTVVVAFASPIEKETIMDAAELTSIMQDVDGYNDVVAPIVILMKVYHIIPLEEAPEWLSRDQEGNWSVNPKASDEL